MISASILVWLALGACDAAYIRTRADNTTCGAPSNAHCLWWPGGSTVTFYQNDRGNPATPDTGTGTTVFDAVTRSWQTWQAVMNDCGSLTIVEGARTSDRTVGYDSGSPNNTNIVLFRQRSCDAPGVLPPSYTCQKGTGDCGNAYDCWDHDRAAIALTTTTYDKNTGRILDADIELNGKAPGDQSGNGFKFTTVDSPQCASQVFGSYTCSAADIQNTATHEFGHSIGLDHTNYVDPQDGMASTMSPNARAGDLTKRRVDSGSRSFVCNTYPKGRSAQDCVPSTSSGGCAAAPGGPLVALALLSLQILRARRARRGG